MVTDEEPYASEMFMLNRPRISGGATSHVGKGRLRSDYEKKNAISRSALASESDACTEFSRIFRPIS